MADHRPINKYYYALLDGISQFLPDMNLTINLHDVPVVYATREDRDRLVALGKAGKCTQVHLWEHADDVVATDQEHEQFAAQYDVLGSDMSWRDLRLVRLVPKRGGAHPADVPSRFADL